MGNITSKKGWIFLRALILHVSFIVLHYIYDWVHNIDVLRNILQIFSAINESNFQHWKIAFFSYWILVLIELIIYPKEERKQAMWWYQRIFGSIILPWAIMVVYYSSFLIFQFPPSILYEIIFANIMLFLASLSTFTFELLFKEKEDIPKALKILLIVFLVLIIAEFIVFTFIVPGYDVFTVPPGFE